MADVLRGLSLLESLTESMESDRLSEVREAVEELLISRVNVALVGERGREKADLLNALRGLGPEDQGAALCPGPEPPEGVVGYPDPKHPDFRLWDLPPPAAPEGYLDRVRFCRYGAVLMVFTRTPPPASVRVFLEARSVQRTPVFFTLLASAQDDPRALEARRSGSLAALAARGVSAPRVYVLAPAALHAWDFPALLEDVARELPALRAQALVLALPVLGPWLVPQKKAALRTLALAAAWLSGGAAAVPVPLVASVVDAGVAARVLATAQRSLCLDERSLESLARQSGADASGLKALRTCALSVEVGRGEVRRRLAAADVGGASACSELVALALPRQARSAGRSFAAMLQALSGAIDDMAADAERITAAAHGGRK
ncbi:immunity-related GTPase family, q2 [Betta splendens]|uniref:Immunity-related GTPase family, q2 n=1 Tax=Betta splendens TaxID=158456 RepID=A0A6P7KV15_BETSP|nr:immunity-related GTPase family, q2 [Betta splendens]